MPDRVIVRLPNWLGDTVMAVPALRAVRASWPGARILAAGPWAPILARQDLADVLAYHTAVARGTDVDQPRNLAKSVTVE